MIRITIEYSENFRENKKASEVLGILIDKGFDPIDLFLRYNPDCRTSRCVYVFQEGTELPTQEKLEGMLIGVDLTEIIREAP